MVDKENKQFIVYLDDNDSKIEAYVDIVEINQSFISFKTYSNNVITIPMRRVLKLKRRDINE